MTASASVVLQNLAYLIGAVALAAFGGLFLWVRQRGPKSVDATVDSFHRGLQALAPGSPRPPRGSGQGRRRPAASPQPQHVDVSSVVVVGSRPHRTYQAYQPPSVAEQHLAEEHEATAPDYPPRRPGRPSPASGNERRAATPNHSSNLGSSNRRFDGGIAEGESPG